MYNIHPKILVLKRMKFNILIVLLSFIFFNVKKINAQSSKKEISRIFNEAYLNAEAKNFQIAIEIYSRYIDFSSNNDSIAIAYFNRGHCYYAISEFQNSYNDFDSTLVIIANDSTIKNSRLVALSLNYRGLCYEKLGLMTEASIDFFLSQLRDSTLFQPVFNGAMNCEAREIYDTAIKEYYRAISLNLEYSNDQDALLHILYRTAMLNRKLENYYDAIDIFEFYLSIDSTNVDVINKLGNTYSSIENEQKALSNYLKANSIDPNFKDAVFNIGLAYLKLNRTLESIKFLNRAILLDPKNSEYYKTIGVAMLIYNKKKNRDEYDFCTQFDKACDYGDCEYLNQFCL